MLDDLQHAWKKMLKKSTYIASSDGVHVSFPQHLFEIFEQEFNIFFIDQDDDPMFKHWQNQSYEGEDDER